MTAIAELSVREAAKRAGRSEETIRRWIWSGRLQAVKRGGSYRIDIRHLEDIIVDLDPGIPKHEPAYSARRMQEWLDEVAEWKSGLVTKPGATAADLVIEDRRARR